MISSESREIPSYDGYTITAEGKIYNRYFRNKGSNILLEVPKEIKQRITPKGYVRVSIRANKRSKHVFVHVLVLLAFRGVCPSGLESSHLDGDRTHNNLDNLIYETRKENHARKIEHGTSQRGNKSSNHKLSEDQVIDIREKLRLNNTLQVDIAKEYGVCESTISYIKLRGWQFKAASAKEKV